MQTLRIGVIGVGEARYRHAANIAGRIPLVSLAAVCSRRRERAEAVRRELGAEAAYTDYRELLADRSIGAVVIASNTCFHPEQIREAFAAGKHIFCEKPLAADPECCRQLEALAAAHPGQILFPGYMRRYDPSYRYARTVLDSGRLGRPYMVSCHSADALASAGRIAGIAGTSGGLFLDMGVHDFDLAAWFLGSRPVSACAAGGTYVCPEFARHGDADNAAAVVTYQSGAVGVFREGRTAAHGYQTEMEIVCEKGSIRVGILPEKNLVTVCDAGGAGRVCPADFLERFREAFLAEMEAFAECVRCGSRPAHTAGDNTAAVITACMARDSLLEGRIVRAEEYD